MVKVVICWCKLVVEKVGCHFGLVSVEVVIWRLGLRLDVGRDTGYLALPACASSDGGQSTTMVTVLHCLNIEVRSGGK